MDSLLRFGAGSETYTFETRRQISLRDNFRDVVPRTTRLPGVNGGFDDLGTGRAEGEIGNVQMAMWVIAGSAAEMAGALEAIGEMATWGVKRLYKRSGDGARREMWCDARVNSIDYTQSANNMPELRQRVVINFQVANPGWFAYPFDTKYLNDGLTMNSGATMAGYSATVVTADTTINVVVGGNVAIAPRVRICSGKYGSGAALVGTVADVRIRRIDADTARVTHDVRWSDTVAQDDALVIDAGAYEVIHEDASAGNVTGYGKLEATRATWLELMPGANRLDVSGTWTGSVAIFIEYVEGWR